MSHATPLEALYQVYRALRGHREEHDLVMEERREYRWILGEDKQIDQHRARTKSCCRRNWWRSA